MFGLGADTVQFSAALQSFDNVLSDISNNQLGQGFTSQSNRPLYVVAYTVAQNYPEATGERGQS